VIQSFGRKEFVKVLCDMPEKVQCGAPTDEGNGPVPCTNIYPCPLHPFQNHSKETKWMMSSTQ